MPIESSATKWTIGGKISSNREWKYEKIKKNCLRKILIIFAVMFQDFFLVKPTKGASTLYNGSYAIHKGIKIKANFLLLCLTTKRRIFVTTLWIKTQLCDKARGLKKGNCNRALIVCCCLKRRVDLYIPLYLMLAFTVNE